MQLRSKRFPLLLILGLTALTLAGSAAVARAQPPLLGSLVTNIANPPNAGYYAANIFVGWLGSQALDGAWNWATNGPNVRDMQQQLDRLAALDRTYASTIRELRNAIHERMTRAEFEQALKTALSRIDRRLVELAEHQQRQQVELERHALALGISRSHLNILQGKMTLLTQRLDRQDTRLTQAEDDLGQHAIRLQRAEADIAEIKSWLPHEQAMRLGLTGFKHLNARNFPEAMTHFRKAHAYDEADPAYLYGLALAYKHAGDHDQAEHFLTRGIAAERKRVPPSWFVAVLEREQGPVRSWFSRSRLDPIHGVRSSGEIRYVDFASTR